MPASAFATNAISADADWGWADRALSTNWLKIITRQKEAIHAAGFWFHLCLRPLRVGFGIIQDVMIAASSVLLALTSEILDLFLAIRVPFRTRFHTISVATLKHS